MPVFKPFTGMPGIGTEKIAKHRTVGADGYLDFLPGGLIIDGAKTRDPFNTDDVTRLEAGLLLGLVTSSGKLATACIGKTSGALAGTGTTITLTAAQAAELVRRVGATGTFKLTGPPTAAGVVRTLTVTYSAVNTTTGVVTITAAGADEVQTVAVDTIVSGGSIDVTAVKSDGTVQTVNVAYNASWTQTVADIQTALIAKLGTAAVACAVTNTHDMTITFSGAGYTGLPQPLVVVDVSAATGPTKATVTRTTAGVDGRFVAASLVGDTDGSHAPVTFLPDGWETPLPDDGTTNADLPLAQPPIAGTVDDANLLPWPADASLKAWVRSSLNSYGKFVFTSPY